jgi:hypothetical protein
VTGATAFQKAATSGGINQSARQIFLSLYPNRHKSILKPRGCKTWVTMSRHASLVDDTIVAATALQDDTIWGCRWGEQTRFAVLDVDETSQYHNELGLVRLRHSLATIGLNTPQIYQSSDSEGWHLYLSFASWVDCKTLHNALKQWLTAEGYQVKSGQLEIFPSNNGLRFPLQRGFAWLDDQGAIKLRREDITADEAISRFVDALDANAHNWQSVQNRIDSRLQEIQAAVAAPTKPRELQNEDIEEDGFSAFFTHAGMIPEVYKFGREYWRDGLAAPGQRHHAVLCVGHYLWYGDESEDVRALPGVGQADQRAAAIEAWLREKHNGFSKSVLRGDWNEVGTDIRRACNWEATEGVERQRASYPLTDRAIDRLEALTKKTGRVWYPDYFKKGNVGREEGAREKIRAALVKLVEAGRRVTVKGLERLSGCRKETIKRHADIWGVFRLSKGLGDLSLLRGAPALVFCSSGSEEVQEKKEILDLGLRQSRSEIEQAASLCSAVAPPSPPQAAATFCLVAYSAEQPCELAPIFSMVFDSLRLKLFGATANNSTATLPVTSSPPLTTSLATGSNTGALACMWVKPGELVCSLNGFLPSSAEPPLGPLHLPQTKIFSREALDANLTATVADLLLGSNGTVSGLSRLEASLALVLGLTNGAAWAGLLRAHPRPHAFRKI